MDRKRDLQLAACLSGIDFEDWVVRALERCGLTAERTGNNDCGVDIIAEYKEGKKIHRFYIQYKFYNKPLGKALLLKRTIADSYQHAENYDKIKVRPLNINTKDQFPNVV